MNCLFNLGLGKLQSTAEEVKDLQVKLTEMKPALEVAAKDAEIMITKIAADTVSISLSLLLKIGVDFLLCCRFTGDS